MSTPAVNKWEKGSTYPDITLLPALARLLKIDLNTLMSFNEDLSDVEIENFVNALDIIVNEQNYEIAFQRALDKIHEYPTCDALIYSATLYLEGALYLYNVPNPEPYRKMLESFYKRLIDCDIQEIRDTAINMLISYARNDEDFAKAEELINTLPFATVDKEEQFAILYQRQGKYEDAQKIWEHRILKSVTDIQTALINMLEWSLRENRNQDAEFLADLYENITLSFYFPEWLRYNAHLLIALEQQDENRCLSILKKMLPAMKNEWNPKDCPLYRYADNSGVTFLSTRLIDLFCTELFAKEEYAFLSNCSEFKKLIAQVKN